MQKEEKKPIPQKCVSICGGAVLLLLCALLFIVPNTHLYFLDYVQVYLFGNPGFYGINALFGFIGLLCIITQFRPFQKSALTRFGFGYFLFFVGTCLLCTLLSSKTVTLNSPSDFNAIMASITLGEGFGTNGALGGGIVGFALLYLCRLSPFSPLPILVISILYFLGFLLWGWSLLARFFRSVHYRIKKAKEEKKQAKLDEALTRSKEIFGDDKTIGENSSTVEEKEIIPPSFDRFVMEEKEDTAIGASIRRRDVRKQYDFEENQQEPLPKVNLSPVEENRSFDFPDKKEEIPEEETIQSFKATYSSPVAPSNMEEAVFCLDEEEKKPMNNNYAPGKFSEVFDRENKITPKVEEKPYTEPAKTEILPTATSEKEEQPPFAYEAPQQTAVSEPIKESAEQIVAQPTEASQPSNPIPQTSASETNVPEKKETVLGPYDISFEDKLAQQKYIEEEERKKEEAAKKASIRYVYFGEDRVKVKEDATAPYRLPDPNEILLDYPPDSNLEANMKEAEERRQRINTVFANFGIQAECVDYTIGPSVTRYYIQLGPTTQIRQIRGIIETLQVQMGGVHGLFREMIKGSPYCGLEVANSKTALVSFKECVLGIPNDKKHRLYVPFGKSIEGNIVSASVAKFPHMLVAGGTGSGKSIFVHGLISTLLMHNSPDELKFLFIDKKRIELGKYEGIPHLLCPVIKEASEAKKALDKLVDEMNRRNRILDMAGKISDIDEFNEDVAPVKGCEKFPHIVAIIDEYADLVDTCKEVNEPVARLTQLARSAGIHLIVATQHPTVDVINGRIKSNIGTRVGLKVTNASDSMTILNAGGAEKLNGHGDMLVDCGEITEAGVFVRLQGCLINKKEISSIVESHMSQRPFVCDPEFENLKEEEPMEKSTDFAMPTAAENRAASEEQLYQQIKESVMKREYVSISAFQREYGLGFGKAGRLFDRLKKEGIVEYNGTSNKGSRVLVHEYVPSEE